MKAITLAVLVLGCSGAVDSKPSLADYESGAVACEPLASPNVGFDGCGEPVSVAPTSPVALVCSCNTAGRYACFGHPGAPTCGGFTVCTTVTDRVPNRDCAAGQLSVTRCTDGGIPNPDPDRCTGAHGAYAEGKANVWCCA